MAGHLVNSDECQPALADDGSQTRVTIDRRCGCQRLVQSVVSFATGHSERSAAPGHEQSLFVLAGTGSVQIDGQGAHEFVPDTAAYVAAGESYAVENSGPDPLVVLVVDAPTPEAADLPELGPRRPTVQFASQPSLEAGIGRTFRLLVDPQIGCPSFTQFLGEIPPGRAPDHSHSYDEVVYIVEGEGVLHMNGSSRPLRAGSCIYLPPLHVHSLENTSDSHMRVLGVFQPAGSPAARYGES